MDIEIYYYFGVEVVNGLEFFKKLNKHQVRIHKPRNREKIQFYINGEISEISPDDALKMAEFLTKLAKEIKESETP